MGMEDPTNPPPSKLNILVYDTKQTMAFAYGFMASFVICILFILLSDPYGQSSSSPNWYIKDAYRISPTHFFPNSSQSFASEPQNTSPVLCLPPNGTQPRKSNGLGDSPSDYNPVVVMNQTAKAQISESDGQGKEIGGLREEQNITINISTSININISTSTNVSTDANTDTSKVASKTISINASTDSNGSELYEHIETMLNCDLFDGKWVKDDSYPLYPHGSCPYVDESFNCFRNGRPDSGYESYRWQPKHCSIPRLKGKDILELIRGKRLVFVGDSLNRNMWVSLVCVLKNSVEDHSRVATRFGRHQFKDYNCSVEFFWSPFLVHEWKTPIKRLRLDLMDMQSDKYKDADILVFNSGHWYTDSKTSNGRNYYQQGSDVYGKLDEFRAYRRGMLTWGKWVDANVNRMNTQIFFRGSSATHYGGGNWNSGGRCDWETKPIKKAKYLSGYPEKMKILESVMKRMRTHVHYLNITRLSAYRKDAHSAAYRRANLTEQERRDPLRFQDCTHWCLPGVPDTWNEILYAQILINHYKKHKQKSST